MTNLAIQLKPGPKALAAALKMAGFSETSIYPAVTDMADQHWPAPSGLQIALALVGGESSGNAWCYHVNGDGTVDYGLLEINSHYHPELFAQYGPVFPKAWNWMNYLDNAQAAYQIHAESGWKWDAWNAYTNMGYLSIRYSGRTWMHWAQHGINQMTASRRANVPLAQIASVDNDPMIYWS